MRQRFELLCISFMVAILILLSFFNVYAMGENEMKSVNLKDLLKIETVDKIIFSTESYAKKHSTLVKEEIVDKEQLEIMLNAINNLEEIPLCDALPQYKLSFYKNNKNLVDLSFFIDGEWNFLRWRSPKGQRDFKPTKEFVDILDSYLKK